MTQQAPLDDAPATQRSTPPPAEDAVARAGPPGRGIDWGDWSPAISRGGASGDGARESARAVFATELADAANATEEFERAERLMVAGDLGEAEARIAAALRGDPRHPEYLALLVWIRAQRRAASAERGGTPAGGWDDLIRLIEVILDRSPCSERALYYRGMLLKRAGREDEAVMDFRMAVEIDPGFLDALREVRLHGLRRSARRGIWTRLFGQG